MYPPIAAANNCAAQPVALSVVEVQPHLRKFVRGAMHIAARGSIAGPDLAVQALPEPTVVMSFQFGDPVSIERPAGAQSLRSHVSGVQHESLRIRADGHTRSLVLKLNPQHANRVLGCPIAEFTDRHVAFGDLFGPQAAAAIEDEIAHARDSAQRLEAAERFVQSRLAGPARRAAHDSLMDRAVELIVESQGQLRVAALADRCGLGERQFVRRFQCHTGVRPKEMARIARLQAALHARQAGAGWAEVAHNTGFADQSHWVREFRRFAGAPPERYFHHPRADVGVYNELLDASTFFNTRFV